MENKNANNVEKPREIFYNTLYCDVVEVCPIPTVDELNEKVWGEGFYATIISKGKFDEIWNTGIYNESLTAT